MSRKAARVCLAPAFPLARRVRIAGQIVGALLVAATAGVAASAVLGQHGARHLARLAAERQRVAEATFALLRGNERLRQEIERLRHDELYVEQLARRQLGLVRPGELVFRFKANR